MAASQPEIYTIFCLVLGEDTPFSIEIANNEMVYYLMEMIKQKKENTFANTHASFLKLYHLEIEYDEHTANMANNAAQKMLAKPFSLRVTTKVANVFKGTPKDDMVHIIVKPPTYKSIGEQKPKSPGFEPQVKAVTVFTEELGDYTIAALRNISNNTQLHIGALPQGVSSPFQIGTSSLPGVEDYQPPPFVSEYLEKLDAKRAASQDQIRQLEGSLGQVTCETHFEPSQNLELSSNELGTYTNRRYQQGLDVIRQFTSSTYKNDHVTVHLVDPALGFDSHHESWRYDKMVAWPPLLLQGTLEDPGTLFTFRPRGGFCFFDTAYGALLLGEIISNSDESDRWRMLLEGTAVCRYQNILSPNRGAIVLCLYLNQKFEMERYLVYEGEGMAHILHDLTLNLTETQDAFLLSKQLFNFREHLVQIPELDKKRRKELLELQEDIRKEYSMSVTGAKQAQSKEKLSSAPQALGQIEEDATLRFFFTAIRILKRAHKDVAAAIRRSDMQSVVLKRVKTASSELRILRFLHSCAPQGFKHIIPLLEVIKQPQGISTLVTPHCTPIAALSDGREEDLALQLIRGVDWLHKLLVCHSDIKQKNLVFDERQNQLLIIDFGLATKLTSREQTVRGARGTAEHVAPEVGITVSWENYLESVSLDEDSVYNPLLADVWAVGDVIAYFDRQFPSSTNSVSTLVSEVAKELKAVDPVKRLSLHDAERRIVVACSMAATALGPTNSLSLLQA